MIGNKDVYEKENNDDTTNNSVVRIIHENQNDLTKGNSLLNEEISNRISQLTNIAKSTINATNNISDIVIGTAKYSTLTTFSLSKSLVLTLLSSAQNIISNTEKEDIKNDNKPELHTPKLTESVKKYFSFGTYIIHQSFSLTELLTLSAFNFTSQSLKFSLKTAEEFVSLIDTLFGSTETSKIIASFVELIMKEFQSIPSLEKKNEKQNKKNFFQNVSIIGIFNIKPMQQFYNTGSITKALIAYAILQHINYFKTLKYFENTEYKNFEEDKAKNNDNNKNDYYDENDISLNIKTNKKNTIIKKLFENITEISESTTKINTTKSVHTILLEMEKKKVLLEGTKEKVNHLKTTKKVNDIVNSIYYHEIVNTSNNNESVFEKSNSENTSSYNHYTNNFSLKHTFNMYSDNNNIAKDSPILKEINKTDTMNDDYSHESFNSLSFINDNFYNENSNYEVSEDNFIIKNNELLIPIPSVNLTQNNNYINSKTDDILSKSKECSKSEVFVNKTPVLSEMSLSPILKNKEDDINNESFNKIDSFFPKVKNEWNSNLKFDLKSTFVVDDFTNNNESYQNRNNDNIYSFIDVNKSNYLSIPYIPTGEYISKKKNQYYIRRYHKRTRNNNSTEIFKSNCLKNKYKRIKNNNKSLLLDKNNYLMNQFINPKRNYPLPNFLNNIYRYAKFVSASYGKTFMQVMNIGIVDSLYTEDSEYPENHYAFSIHTKIPLNCILLSSFSSSYSTDSYIYNNKDPHENIDINNIKDPSCLQEIVYYLILDHKSKSLVLTLRGTLGLTDVLTDLTCNYLDIEITFEDERNNSTTSKKDKHIYSVHSGMYYAAKWLAYDCKKLHEIINITLKKYPKYGLVICGHSLGGGVASLLSILWSIPKYKSINAKSWVNTSFVTSQSSGLISGRPIYCYTYGCPSVMSLGLSKRCKGLVTTIINQYDVIPRLSVGLIKDIKNAINYLLDENNNNICEKIINKLLINNANIMKTNETNNNSTKLNTINLSQNKELIKIKNQDDEWLWNALCEIRKTFVAEKLSPPGTIYWINKSETRIKKKNLEGLKDTPISDINLYYRIKLYKVNPIFVSELVFAKTILTDHSPNEYEKSIKLLIKSINSIY